MKKLSALLLCGAIAALAVGCTDDAEKPPTSPEFTSAAPDAVGTPADVVMATSPVTSDVVLAPSATSSSNGGPAVGVLAYCTDLTGWVGAQNTANTLIADGRFGPVTVIDGDVAQPTAQDLLDDFQCVIAMTDSRCGVPIPQSIADAAADAMTGFAQAGGGVVLSTFGFSHRPSGGIGFGASIFGAGLSPLQQATPYWNASAGAIDVAGASTTPPCDQLMAGVTSPVSSSYANYVSLSSGATLCASYTNGRDLLAINAAGNVVGLNTFPASGSNNNQASYRRLVSNAVFAVCIIPVDIDIKPGSFPNSINRKSKGNVPVALLSSATFDATTADRSTVEFADASPLDIGKSPEDVNDDGLLDVVFHFATQSLNLPDGTTEACMTGKTTDGRQFKGCDSVRLVK
ncbi:MAG: hypothetical protein GTN78_25700 [Gemmatimonadales bacterium]|nr:hypothetical protein [Gemmatimonadales bacterium]NIN12554.1 hypothetical protein [Gemmatimonadales bacterium]NIR03549.1 hypothetical protein [Gemmatimonadales bacterium]NIS65871.1 hypothetical protein [Gemmatimonadales bacterium]